MKKMFFTFSLTMSLAILITSCSYKEESELSNKKTEDIITQDIQLDAKKEIDDSYNDYSQIPKVGGSDYSFSRKFVDEVYNIQIAAEIVGEEKRNDWVNNIFLKKTPEEQDETPTLYQMIVDLDISKEDLIRKNNEYIDFPEQYIPMEIIDSLYEDDIKTVKKKLMSPLALYYNEEIYTFEELSKSTRRIDIPSNVLEEYIDYIEVVCEENGIMKYMQEEIDTAKKYVAQAETIK